MGGIGRVMAAAHLQGPAVSRKRKAFLPGCSGKVAQSYDDALATVLRRRLKFGAMGGVYCCKWCGAWHTSHELTHADSAAQGVHERP